MSSWSDRPVLLGMNNPLSDVPEAAFFPRPGNSAGARLLSMLQLVRPEIKEYHFLRAFDRRNVLDMKRWVPEFARVIGPQLWREFRGRRVVVFGAETAHACGLPRSPLLAWQEHEDVIWCAAPHPSGRNLWYNNDLHRMALALRLERLYDEALLG